MQRLEGQLEAGGGAPVEAGAEMEGTWPWLEPFVDVASLSVAQQASFAAWLLADARECELKVVGRSCGEKLGAYPTPGYRDPEDPCWKLSKMEEVANTSDSAALIANLDDWVELVAETDFRSRGPVDVFYDVEESPSEAIIGTLLYEIPAETIVPALVLGIDSESPIPLEAIEHLEDVSEDEAIATASSLLDALRLDYGRCEEVRALAEVLDEKGGQSVAWQADLDDACDILFVMCTELQPDLEDLVVGPSGFTVTESCADDRPTEPEAADAWGVSLCTPAIEHLEYFDTREHYGISPEIAAACGSDEYLTEYTYSCGALDEFEVYTYRWHDDASGRVWFDGLDILHTTVQ